jgi:rhodanese-related sulfurtransferase
MHQVAKTIQLNRAVRWLIPIAIIVLLVLNMPTRNSPTVNEISASDAKDLIDAGAVVVDVRGREAYGRHHLPGALAIPLAELRTAIPASLAFAKGKSIVVYCNDGVRTGPEGTQLLNQAGYGGAVNLKSGIEGWERAGYPVAKQ